MDSREIAEFMVAREEGEKPDSNNQLLDAFEGSMNVDNPLLGLFLFIILLPLWFIIKASEDNKRRQRIDQLARELEEDEQKTAS